jgi:hypothetical protein
METEIQIQVQIQQPQQEYLLQHVLVTTTIHQWVIQFQLDVQKATQLFQTSPQLHQFTSPIQACHNSQTSQAVKLVKAEWTHVAHVQLMRVIQFISHTSPTVLVSTDAAIMDLPLRTVALMVSTGIQQETSVICQAMPDVKAVLQCLDHSQIQTLAINIQLLSQWLHAHKFELFFLMVKMKNFLIILQITGDGFYY